MLGIIRDLFSPRVRLPQDATVRIPKSVRKAAADEVDAMRTTLGAIADLPGIADVKTKKRVPKGFYTLAEDFMRQYDRYEAKIMEAWGDGPAAAEDGGWRRPGTPEGRALCQSAPTPLTTIETLTIYRKVRHQRNFQQVGEALGAQGQQLFEDLQNHNRGKDPEQLKLTGRSLQRGRRDFAQRGLSCPFLDPQRGRCQIWDHRPIACRQHHVTGPSEWTVPSNENHVKLKTRNIRLPVKIQVEMRQLEKRMGLEITPFLSTGILQLLQLTEGTTLPEVGEVPARIRKDGSLDQRANRNARGSKRKQKQGQKKRK